MRESVEKMPLVRVEVRNEYGLGMPELYKEANNEDPKALLEGVAVAGLVGILRQLGDLAEFAAEVFHGLQEQVMNTSSRSHKLMVRVQNIEAAFPPLENTILAQRSHLHFAYTTGLQWHVRIQSERNHFIYSDLPRFIMDSYEECRGPPHLHLLDKFDTGGPGSCVKRYSDPTFFRRASAGFDEAYVEKVPRNKKARRRKKKKTWLKNGEVPHGVSHGTLISSYSGRMQYDSRNFDGQTSPSQTVSTFNAALKSELAEHSNSFDSRAGSGYIECVFSPSYSMKPDGYEPEEISSQLKLHHSDTLDTSSLGEQSGVVNDEIQEQTDTRSSCVTWDEKTEIMEPTGLQYQFDETTEKLPTNFNPDPPEGEAVNIRTADQMEFNFDNESMLATVSCGNQLDDIESETDNYMDALNTIESESEIDLECQTKREVEQFSSLNNKEADGGTNKLTPPRYLDSRSSNSETHVPAHVSSNKATSEENHNSVIPESPKAANSFLNEETSIAKPNSVPTEFYATEHSPQEAGKSSSLDTLPDIDSSGSDEILDGSNVETVVRSSSVSRKPILQAPNSDTILSSSCESQKSPSLASGVTGVNFWTNGGLLGLEPSKPPDFSVLNSGNHESMAKSKGETFLPSSRSTILEGDRNSLKTNIIENSDFHHSISSNKPEKLVFSETSTKIPGTEEAINPDVQATKSWEYDGKNSSRMFEFSNRLLVNGFQKKVSHFGDGNLVGSVKNGVSEQKSGSQSYKTFPGRNFKEQFGCGSPSMSPSSPPLEHMKISFQPIDGFETHKLKLKLPDGSECHESSGDMFPSFQLVPEKLISLQDLGSDSDDDTFCRSSPRPSDDCLSHYSESDSEEWETGESPRCKDHEIYDALGPESVSSNLEIGRMAEVIIGNYELQSPFTENGMEPSHSGRLHDLPSFDTLNTSLGEELHRNSDAKYPLESDFSKEPTPSPPPLPPVEWCAMNPNPDMAIEKQDSPFEAVKHAFDQKLSAFTISHQPKPAPVKHDQNTEAIACMTKSKQPDLQKLNGQNDADQSSNSKGVDEKEDFLQQIRTKSFSLRRTMTDRQTTTPGVPANVSVTAILEKANAIRQAVGSDEGEDDDTWSDA